VETTSHDSSSLKPTVTAGNFGSDSGRFLDGQKNHETAKRKLEQACQPDGRSDRLSELLVATGVHWPPSASMSSRQYYGVHLGVSASSAK
jgi:hypothetical protein